MTSIFDLTEEEGDTLAGALNAATKGQTLNDDERAALAPIAKAFRRHAVLIRVAGDNAAFKIGGAE